MHLFGDEFGEEYWMWKSTYNENFTGYLKCLNYFKLSYQVLVPMAAQFKDIYSRLAKNNWKEAGGSPRQSQLLF